MNYISGSILLICLFACTACGAPASENEHVKGSSNYAVHYSITPEPGNGAIAIEMRVEQNRGQLRELSFALSDSRTSGFEADGELHVDVNRVRWLPDRDGGTLRWTTRVSQQRRGNGYDAWLDDYWGIFRAEDIIPRARTRTLKGSHSETSMTFELPPRWSAISEY
jgi:hypothetical protein